MDPISLGLTAASGVVGAMGAMQSAGASADAARYQAGVARNNQIQAEQNARRSVQAGRVQSQNQDFKTRQALGQTEAAQSASGIQTDTGTPALVRQNISDLGRLDASTLVDNAMMKARSDMAQATSFKAEAGLQEMKASQAEAAGPINALSSVLTAGASFATKWSRFQSYGVT